MEKKQKSFGLGTKPKRKISLRGASSEPKNLIVDTPPIDLDKHQVSIPKSKMSVKTKSIFPEPTTLEPTQRPPKKKLQKANLENSEIDEPKEKKKKHSSDIIKTKKGHDATQMKKKKTHDLLADIQKKKKKENELITELHNLKAELGTVKAKDEEQSSEVEMQSLEKAPMAKLVYQVMNMHNTGDKFPILNDKKLIERFLKVPMSNNQKGRIRQAIKLSLQGTTAKIFPDIINGKIQAILSSATDLTDSDLRRLRILHNMLKTAITSPGQLEEDSKMLKSVKEKKKKEDGDKKGSEQKVKGPKRYVVFLGNLPLNITKEKIMEHFRELNEQIISIRLPKREAAKKSAIAYVELRNEPSYELALSKHHSMMGTKRIRVLYTAQQKGKITKGEAKAKSAKMIALQKAGKLVGSVPANKKRSHRRAIMNKAKAKQAAEAAVENK